MSKYKRFASIKFGTHTFEFFNRGRDEWLYFTHEPMGDGSSQIEKTYVTRGDLITFLAELDRMLEDTE